MSKTLPANAHIGRPLQPRGGPECTIQITDKASGCLVVTLHLSFSDLAVLTLTHGDVDVTAEYRLDNLGKTREVKYETVEWDFFERDTISKEDALAPYEVDGWVGSESDLGNHHRSVKNTPHGYKVGFVRWVEKD